jgi:hypothetical protein
MVRSFMDSGWSAATQVKAVQPRNFQLALGHEVVCSEASIAAGVKRRVCRGVPGSRAAAGHPPDHVGTWEGRIACMPRQAEKARTGHGDTVVGPTHSRGVAGVTPGGGPVVPVPLEGVGSSSSRVKAVEAIH